MLRGKEGNAIAMRSRVALLHNHPLFRELPRDVLEQLASYMTRRTAKRGTPLFVKGDPGNGLMGVLTGSVKISVLSADGHETVLNIIREGEIFGEIALLDGRPRTADATALSDCELMVIDRRDFVPFVQREPRVALKLIEVLCDRLRRTSAQVEDIAHLDLPGRLAKTLLQMAGHTKKSEPRISITQRELGQMIGMSRESTNKQLRQWAQRKWVRLDRGGVAVLKPEALEEIAAQHGDTDSR
jgi:CRP-like cAMP-binding protein